MDTGLAAAEAAFRELRVPVHRSPLHQLLPVFAQGGVGLDLLLPAIGYPMAYAIAHASPTWRTVLLMMIVLPFWTSFLLRVYAWIGLLKNNGVINNILMYLGLIHEPLPLLQSDFAVYIGIVYSYLPFMILPLYANLEKHDNTLLEAAADLGATPMTAFFRITLPQSVAGSSPGRCSSSSPRSANTSCPRSWAARISS